MRSGIHPDYDEVVVTCGCGNSFPTRSTARKVAVEICSVCHPFYTGKQKLLDTAGMVEKFAKKWESDAAKKKAEEHVERKKVSVADRAADRAARVMRGEIKLNQLDSLIKKEPKPPEPPLPRIDQPPAAPAPSKVEAPAPSKAEGTETPPATPS